MYCNPIVILGTYTQASEVLHVLAGRLSLEILLGRQFQHISSLQSETLFARVGCRLWQHGF